MPSPFYCSSTYLALVGAHFVGLCWLNHPIPLAVRTEELAFKKKKKHEYLKLTKNLTQN